MSRPRLFCLNRCLVVRKGIAEMVADASTHAVMYQVKVLGGILLYNTSYKRGYFFLQVLGVFSGLLSSVTISSPSTSLTSNSHTNH